MNKISSLLLLILYFYSWNVSAKPKDYLRACWQQQVEPLQTRSLSFSFYEKKNDFDHGWDSFQVRNYTAKGTIWINANNFLKSDTLTSGQRTYFSKTHWSTSTLLFLDYGDTELFASTNDMHQNSLFQNARYSPVNLIDYFTQKKVPMDKESNKEFAVYRLIHNGSIVKLFIRKSDSVVDKVSILCATDFINDQLFGDVLTTISYKEYVNSEGLVYPTSVRIEKINGKLTDEITITSATIIEKAPELLTKPEGYVLTEKAEPKPEVVVEKYSDAIYFIQLKHTDDKVMIVEFRDFLVVAEAPLNSSNGELIINEARKIAPNKPIRYFIFGHFHTHYIGGVRAFVHKGATVLAAKANIPYVDYIVHAAHTLVPDSLQLEPKPLKIEDIGESKTITDGSFEMKVYFIGAKSQHTNDYLIYYFPSEQLLFEDDLVWISREGEIKKAGARQAGLYNAIQELGLTVNTIVQSWPVKDYGVKTVIPFSDLKQSMQVK